MSKVSDDKLVFEAKERFKRCEDWEKQARINYVFDMKFANGDATNLYQWPEEVTRNRAVDHRPCLTVNKTRQHCLQVINDQRQHPTQIHIRPTGNQASYDAGEVFEGLVRHIENQSNAQNAYSNASYCQVVGGIGYWRITTDWAGEDSFEQEIYIRRVADPLSIYLDPDIQQADGSDASFGFVFTDMPRDEFVRQYGEDDDMATSPLGFENGEQGHRAWETKDHVRVVEYFRKIYKPDKLHELDNGMVIKESEVRAANKNDGLRQALGLPESADLLDQLKQNSSRARDIETPEIEWYLIAGSKIINRNIWPGKYIPLVRVIGEETVIDGMMDRKGHTRCLIDPQRIYNYWTSSAVEAVALQTKTPFLAAIEAVRGFEEDWASANIENKSWLPYNALTENGEQITPPTRVEPPVMSQAYLDGLRISAQEMMMASGQYEANMGQKSNEVSGKAVDARERQGDNATYHYIDRMAEAIRYTGRILVDLIPKVYDTERVVAILEPDGTQRMVQVNPNHPQAHSQLANPDGKDYKRDAIMAIFNPAVGRYEVEADVGPEYATRRQETFNAITQILQYNEALMPVIGDLLFRAADFPLADEIAERLKNMVPPQALGDQSQNPQVQQMQQLLAQQHEVLTKLQGQSEQYKARTYELAAKLVSSEQQKHLDQYKAETDRMNALGKIDPDAFIPVIRQLVSEALGTDINPQIAKHKLHQGAIENTIAEQAPENNQPETQSEQ